MLLRCFCGSANRVDGGEQVRATQPDCAPPPAIPSVVEDAGVTDGSLQALRAHGDAQAAQIERQLRRLEAHNARQLEEVMRLFDDLTAGSQRMQQALSEGLDRITANPQLDAEAEELMQRLQDEVDLERRWG